MACPLCAADGHEREDDLRVSDNPAAARFAAGRSIHRCGRCGARFTWPAPTVEEIDAYYGGYRTRGGASADVASSRFGLDADLRFSSRGLSALAFVTPRWGARLAAGASMLDVGPGPGEMLRIARAVYPAARLQALEPDRAVARLLGANGIEVTPQRLDQLPEGALDGTVDFVVLMMVLEHVVDPHGLVARSASLLGEGGEIYVRVPNYDEGQFQRRSGDDGHLLFLSMACIIDVFGEHGLVPVVTAAAGPTWEGAIDVAPGMVRRRTGLGRAAAAGWSRIRRVLSPSTGRLWYEDFVSHPDGNMVQAIFVRR